MVLHEDGSCDSEILEVLSEMFSGLRIVRRSEADAVMEAKLAGHPACLAYRRRHALAMKLFDVPAFASTPRVLLLDSDLLFYP